VRSEGGECPASTFSAAKMGLNNRKINTTYDHRVKIMKMCSESKAIFFLGFQQLYISDSCYTDSCADILCANSTCVAFLNILGRQF